MPGPLHGTLAAAVTPLTSDGDRVDAAAVAPLVDFYARTGLDGLLLPGTTGEGILLDPGERRVITEAFLAAAGDRLSIAVHCGAQSTRDTVALAAHAAAHGASAVAVIPPPYFALDGPSLLHHLGEAARAAAPVPFYVYEFAARSGDAVPSRCSSGSARPCPTSPASRSPTPPSRRCGHTCWRAWMSSSDGRG